VLGVAWAGALGLAAGGLLALAAAGRRFGLGGRVLAVVPGRAWLAWAVLLGVSYGATAWLPAGWLGLAIAAALGLATYAGLLLVTGVATSTERAALARLASAGRRAASP
jgi:hypothetical protein